MGNFYFSIFFQLTWKFLGLASERGGSVCWPNNKIIDCFSAAAAGRLVTHTSKHAGILILNVDQQVNVAAELLCIHKKSCGPSVKKGRVRMIS